MIKRIHSLVENSCNQSKWHLYLTYVWICVGEMWSRGFAQTTVPVSFCVLSVTFIITRVHLCVRVFPYFPMRVVTSLKLITMSTGKKEEPSVLAVCLTTGTSKFSINWAEIKELLRQLLPGQCQADVMALSNHWLARFILYSACFLRTPGSDATRLLGAEMKLRNLETVDNKNFLTFTD